MDSCCDKNIKLTKKVKQILIGTVLIFFISFLPFLESLNSSLIEYFKLIWWAVLLGLLVGGLIDYFVPDEFIYSILGKSKFLSIIYAVIAGFLMAGCSHGILAISMQLYKKGASIPSVIAFLLASPWANLPITILLFTFFGLKALFFIFGALFIAVITGIIFMWLEKSKLIEQSLKKKYNPKYTWPKFHINKKMIKGVYNGSISLANMVLLWIIIGFFMAAVIRAYVPSHYFMQYFGPTMSGLFLTLVFAIIIEVCSEGSAPIAFEIFSKVGALGNPFVFLMAGVATDYTEIGLIWQNIGMKTAIWLPIITVPMIIGFGILFNIYL